MSLRASWPPTLRPEESRTPEIQQRQQPFRMEPTFIQRSLASSLKRSTPLIIFSGSQTMADITRSHPEP